MALQKSLVLFFLYFVLLFSSKADSANNFYITDFGAVGDGSTLNTRAIQAAIDSCARSGGGRVWFPAGTFLSGTLYLKDNVTLYLDIGATLLASVNIEDYPLNVCDAPSYSDSYVARALIWGENLANVGIIGRGKIDGQGAKFRDKKPTPEEWKELVSFFKDTTRYRPQARYINRPYIIRLISCRNILVEGITMINSPMWMQQYLNCDLLTIKNITVNNHGAHNNDMMDIDGCRNVIISGCHGDTDDDGITIKSTGPWPTENVVISNCLISSFCNAIKMGTESSGGFRNITISNCVIRPSTAPDKIYGRAEGLAGIALEIVDGGTLDGVAIYNISIVGTTAPIFIRLGDRGRTYKPNMPAPPVGVLRNVVISNIVATGAGDAGCSITGVPGHAVENVTLSNIKIHFVGGGARELSEAIVPENEKKYPESTMFGVLPAYAFFSRHVNGLTFRDVTLSYEQPEQRPVLIVDDVQNLKIDNLSAQTATEAPAQMVVRNVHHALVSHCGPQAPVFLRLENKCRNISVIGNDLSRVDTPFSFDADTPQGVVYAKNNRMK